MTHICVTNLGCHWSTYWFVACSVPSHYLNQCCVIVIWTLIKEQTWVKLNSKFKYFQSRNALKNAVWKMLAIMYRTQCGSVGIVSVRWRRHVSHWTHHRIKSVYQQDNTTQTQFNSHDIMCQYNIAWYYIVCLFLQQALKYQNMCVTALFKSNRIVLQCQKW